MLPLGMPAASTARTPERKAWVPAWPPPMPWSRFEKTVNLPRCGSSGLRFSGSAAAGPASVGKKASAIMPNGLATQTNRRGGAGCFRRRQPPGGDHRIQQRQGHAGPHAAQEMPPVEQPALGVDRAHPGGLLVGRAAANRPADDPRYFRRGRPGLFTLPRLGWCGQPAGCGRRQLVSTHIAGSSRL